MRSDIARTFRELRTYQAARAAAGEIFQVSKRFPNEERYSLTDQIRRSSRATKTMLAEAWGRRRYIAVFINKIDEALGEANETRAWLDDAFDASYIDEATFGRIHAAWEAIAAKLSRMIDRAPDFCKNPPNFNYRVLEEDDL